MRLFDCGPVAVSEPKPRRIPIVPLDDDRVSENPFETEAESFRRGDRWRIEGVALPFVASVSEFESESDFIKWVSSIDNATDPLFYAIIDLATNKSVGIASYLRIDTHNRTVEVGWLTFSEQLRRSAAATEAMYLMATHAFELGYRRYEWKCNALNAPSIAAAERLGFSFEGVFRNAVIVKGHNRDTAWFGFTDGDWPAIKQAHETWLDASNFDEAGNQKSSLRDLTAPLRHSAWPTLTVER